MADTEAVQSAAEIMANMEEYRAQRAAVAEMLALEPSNAEYREMASNLDEVLELTEDLLRAAQASEGATVASASGADGATPLAAAYPEGSACEALWTEDLKWYDATVVGHTAEGALVLFKEYEEKEPLLVQAHQIRPPTVAVEVYQGVAAPKRHKVEDKALPSEVPKKLLITDADDEVTRDRKRKQIKAFKNRVRMQQKDTETAEKQTGWQAFIQGKGSKKKKVPKGVNKESMFKSPESVDGKVGVTGSGRGITEFAGRARPDRS